MRFPILTLCCGLIFLILVIALVWRLASRRYKLPCPSWLGWLVEADNPFNENNSAQGIIRRLDLQPGMRVVDIGCGPGRVTIPLAQALGAQGEVLAVDIQPAMLRRVQAKAQALNLSNIRFLQAGVGEGKLEPDQFDRALLVTVLGEIPDRSAAMQEIFTALKPGGILSVTEIIMDPHYQRRSTILGLAVPLGFRESTYTGSRFAFTLHLQKPAIL